MEGDRERKDAPVAERPCLQCRAGGRKGEGGCHTMR